VKAVRKMLLKFSSEIANVGLQRHRGSQQLRPTAARHEWNDRAVLSSCSAGTAASMKNFQFLM